MTQVPSKPKRWRRLRRLLLWTSALVLLLAFALFAWLSSDWGRETIRSRAQRAVSESIAGSLTLGKLEGQFWDQTTLKDIVLSGPTPGPDVLRIDSLSLDLALAELFDHRATIQQLDILGAHLQLKQDASGNLNLLQSIQSMQPGEGGTPWPLALQSINVRDSRVEFSDTKGLTSQLDNLQLKASLTSSSQGMKLHIEALSATTLHCGGLPLSLSGDLTISELGFESESLEIQIGQSRAKLTNLRVANQGNETEGKLEGELSLELLSCIAPQLQWHGILDFQARATRSQGQNIELSATMYQGQLALQNGRIDVLGQAFSAQLRFKNFHPNTLAVLPVDLQVQGDITLAANASEQGPTASLLGQLNVQVDDYPIQVKALSIESEGHQAHVAIELAGSGAMVKASSTLDWSQEPLRVINGSVEAEVANLSTLPLPMPLRGSLMLSRTHLNGDIGSLEVSGSLTGRGLGTGPTRSTTSKLDFKFAELGTTLAGTVNLNIKGLAHGKERIGPVRLSIQSDSRGRVFTAKGHAGRSSRLRAQLNATAQVDANKTSIAFRTLTLQHRKLRAHLRPAAMHSPQLTLWKDGDLSINQLSFAVNQGSITTSGQLSTQLTTTLRGVELAPFLPLLPSFQVPLRGSVHGKLVTTQNAAGTEFALALRSDALQLEPGSEQLKLKLDGHADVKQVRAQLELSSQDKGQLSLSVTAARPKGALRPQHLSSAHFGLRQMDLRLLRPLHPELRSASGTLNGEFDIGPGARSLKAQLHAHKLEHARWTTQREGALTIDATQAKVLLELSASDSAIGSAQATIAVIPPGPLHQAMSWSLEKEHFRESSLSLRQVDLQALQRLLGTSTLPIPLDGGLLSAKLKVHDKVKAIRFESTLQGLKVMERPPFDLRLDADLGDDRTQLDWTLRADAHNALQGSASLGAGLTLLAYKDDPEQIRAAIEQAALQAEFSLRSQSPAALTKLAGIKSDLDLLGRVTASATLEGTLKAPEGSLSLKVDEAKIDRVKLQALSLTATYSQGAASARLTLYQDDARHLSGNFEVDIAKAIVRSGSIEAKNIDLRILHALDTTGDGILASVEGIASGNFKVQGPFADLTPQGTLQVRKGGIDLGGTFMPLTAVDLTLVAKEKRLHLEGKSTSGSGRISLTGQANIDQGLKDIALELRTTKLPVIVASLVCTVDLHAHTQIDWKPGLWDIRTNIDSALINVPIRSFVAGSRSLHSIDRMSDLVYISDKAEPEKLVLDEKPTLVRVRTRGRKSVVVRTRELLARIDLDLDTTIDSGLVMTAGRAEIVSGHIDLFERRYVIEKAIANLNSRVPVNPSFDFSLRHDFDALSLRILGRGFLDDPKISFLSEPADYDQSTLLSIVLGQAPAQNENQEGLRDNAMSALSTYAANVVQDLIGVDVDVMRTQKTDNDGDLYIAGHWINDKWFLAYHHRTLAEELENTNEVESKYKLSKSWTLEGVFGDSESGVDVLWTKRWGE